MEEQVGIKHPEPLQSVSGRDISALLNARPVMIVGAHHANSLDAADPLSPENSTSCAATHETCFATIAWAMPLSHDPAMVALSIRERSRTFELLRAAGCFSISTLDGRDCASPEIATYCGNTTGQAEDKATSVLHKLIQVKRARGTFIVPTLDAALSWLACEIESIRSMGDHMLVCAYVREAKTRCGIDAQGRIASLDTLLCIQHDVFGSIDTENMVRSIR